MRKLLLLLLAPLLLPSLPALALLFFYRAKKYRRRRGLQEYSVPSEHPLELYFMQLSLCSSKVLFAFEAAGIDVHKKEIDIGHFGRFQQLESSFLRINPNACVPVLVHEGKPILESDEILKYLAGSLSPGSLIPSEQDPEATRVMQHWLDRGGFVDMRGTMDAKAGAAVAALSAPLFAVDHRYMGLATLVKALFKHPQPQVVVLKIANWFLGGVKPPPKMIDEAFSTLTSCFADMETVLAKSGKWLSGDTFTLADVTWAANFVRLDMLGVLQFFLKDREHTSAYWSRLQQYPGFDAAFVQPLTQSAEFLELHRVSVEAKQKVARSGAAAAYGWTPA